MDPADPRRLNRLWLLRATAAARPQQLAGRATRPLRRRLVPRARPRHDVLPLDGLAALWRSCAFAGADESASDLTRGLVRVLGREVEYPPERWRVDDRLRTFHLHYGEEILGAARGGDPEALAVARNGIDHWIAANPPGRGDGWHPYPLSTRVGNWVAAATLAPSLRSPRLAASLDLQVRYLRRNVEWDVLGNHLIRNARGLVLGGTALADARSVRQGLSLLRRQLAEQVLDDGGHYERSPGYHLVVLRDLQEVSLLVRDDWLSAAAAEMSAFAAALSRPDGRPAAFNDSPQNLAPALALPAPRGGVDARRASGYVVVRRPGLWLVADVGAPAPAFLPPHAHADALSFQLWVGDEPVVVDPGMATYERGRERDRFRSGGWHSTVRVDGIDQFPFWGAFRAGPFPRVELLSVTGDACGGELHARVSSVPGLPGITHRRTFRWSADEVVVEDVVDGHGVHRVESVLPLAPGASVGTEPLRVGATRIEATGGLDVAVEQRYVAEELYAPVPAPAIVARGRLPLPARVGWRFALPSS